LYPSFLFELEKGEKMKKLKTIFNDVEGVVFDDLVNDFTKDKKVDSIQCQTVLKKGVAYPIAFIVYEVE